MARPCSICTDPTRLAFVIEHLRFGRTPNAIEVLSRQAAARDLGLTPIKYETVLKHIRHSVPEEALPKEPRISRAKSSKGKVPSPETEKTPGEPPPEVPVPAGTGGATYEYTPGKEQDVAVVVQQKTLKALDDGTLRVTTQHGLQAQAMIDRREDRKRDRELAINIARMLSGSVAVPSRLVVTRSLSQLPETIEGEFTPILEQQGGE